MFFKIYLIRVKSVFTFLQHTKNIIKTKTKLTSYNVKQKLNF